MKTVRRCCGEVYRGMTQFSTCGQIAKHDRDGKFYCGTHDPVSKAARSEARQRERNLAHSATSKMYAAAEAKRQETLRRAGCFDTLLTQLKHMVQWHDQLTPRDIAQAKVVITECEASS